MSETVPPSHPQGPEDVVQLVAEIDAARSLAEQQDLAGEYDPVISSSVAGMIEGVEHGLRNEPVVTEGYTIQGTDEFIPGTRTDHYSYTDVNPETGYAAKVSIDTEIGKRLERYLAAHKESTSVKITELAHDLSELPTLVQYQQAVILARRFNFNDVEVVRGTDRQMVYKNRHGEIIDARDGRRVMEVAEADWTLSPEQQEALQEKLATKLGGSKDKPKVLPPAALKEHGFSNAEIRVVSSTRDPERQIAVFKELQRHAQARLDLARGAQEIAEQRPEAKRLKRALKHLPRSVNEYEKAVELTRGLTERDGSYFDKRGAQVSGETVARARQLQSQNWLLDQHTGRDYRNLTRVSSEPEKITEVSEQTWALVNELLSGIHEYSTRPARERLVAAQHIAERRAEFSVQLYERLVEKTEQELAVQSGLMKKYLVYRHPHKVPTLEEVREMQSLLIRSSSLRLIAERWSPALKNHQQLEVLANPETWNMEGTANRLRKHFDAGQLNTKGTLKKVVAAKSADDLSDKAKQLYNQFEARYLKDRGYLPARKQELKQEIFTQYKEYARQRIALSEALAEANLATKDQLDEAMAAEERRARLAGAPVARRVGAAALGDMGPASRPVPADFSKWVPRMELLDYLRRRTTDDEDDE